MLFCTTEYLIFFLVVFALYWALPSTRWRTHLLLAASFYFYAAWSPQLALLIVFSTTVDFLLARGIEASRDTRKKRLLLTVNIAGNLGLLCYFKYANFFLDSLRAVLASAGLSGASIRTLDIIVPVGISFYTFEAISYMVDVYRGRIRAERNLAHFQLFILFFPHLVAGPIVRGRDFLPQVPRRKRFNWLRMQVGVQLFLMGLFKKLAIADRMAQFADPVFADPSAYNTGAVWVAVIAYALQIYCDFSGYSDMAIGCAHMLGFKLNRNFDMPYLAANVSEFWRRWHMSLGSWLRDYLFVPLGGSRGGPLKVARNLMITMTLGGLWHGTSWAFVFWGVLHGSLLIVHRAFRAFAGTQPRLERLLVSVPGTMLRRALTLACVAVGWVFFRATSFGAAVEVLRGLAVPREGLSCPLHDIGLWCTLLVVALCHAIVSQGIWRRVHCRLPAPVLGVGYALTLSLVQVLAPASGQAFIYFQF